MASLNNTNLKEWPSVLVTSLVFVSPFYLHDSGQQITAEWNIQCLKLNFYRKNHCRKAGNGSFDSSQDVFFTLNNKHVFHFLLLTTLIKLVSRLLPYLTRRFHYRYLTWGGGRGQNPPELNNSRFLHWISIFRYNFAW